MNSPARPLIGLTGRRALGAAIGMPPGFADAQVESYLSEYSLSVLRSGGLPVNLPLDAPAKDLAAHLDGLVIVGGEDVDPRRYHSVPGIHTTKIDPERDEAEIALVNAAIDADIPILGICRGMQLLNVARGGTLIPHLEAGVGESHGSYAYPRQARVHGVTFTEGSLHEKIYGRTIQVNSFHHQAVDRPGNGVVITGTAPDGVAESLHVLGTRAIAVQWHPEVFGTDPLFDWLTTQATHAKGTVMTH